MKTAIAPGRESLARRCHRRQSEAFRRRNDLLSTTSRHVSKPRCSSCRAVQSPCPEMAEDLRTTNCVETASTTCLPKGCPRSSFTAPGHFHLRVCMLCAYRSVLYGIHYLARLPYAGSCLPVKVVQCRCGRRRQREVNSKGV